MAILTSPARMLVRRVSPFPRSVVCPAGTRPKSLKAHENQQPPASKANITIPGPSWIWLEPLISTIVIWFLGDLSAQRLSLSEDGTYSPSRALRSVTIGSIISIPSYRWFIFLGESFNFGSRLLSLITKIVVNQLTFAPLFNTYFFSMHSLLSGATFEELVERVRQTLPTSWLNSCKLWPAVTAFSFTFIGPQYRSIFAGLVAIGWQTWLTLLNQRTAAREKAEHERQHEIDSQSHSGCVPKGFEAR